MVGLILFLILVGTLGQSYEGSMILLILFGVFVLFWLGIGGFWLYALTHMPR